MTNLLTLAITHDQLSFLIFLQNLFTKEVYALFSSTVEAFQLNCPMFISRRTELCFPFVLFFSSFSNSNITRQYPVNGVQLFNFSACMNVFTVVALALKTRLQSCTAPSNIEKKHAHLYYLYSSQGPCKLYSIICYTYNLTTLAQKKPSSYIYKAILLVNSFSSSERRQTHSRNMLCC